jgi:hypothetical protein
MKLLFALLRSLLPTGDAETMLGDLAEEYALRKSGRWLMGQVLRSLFSIYWARLRGRAWLRNIGLACAAGIFLLLLQAVALFAANAATAALIGFLASGGVTTSGVVTTVLSLLADFLAMLGISPLFCYVLGQRGPGVACLLAFLTFVLVLIPRRVGLAEIVFAVLNPLMLLAGNRLGMRRYAG